MTRNSRTRAETLHAEGLAELARGNLAAAAALWDEALAHDPGHGDAAVNATLAALQLGRWAEAEARARDARARGVADPRLALWLGHALVRQEREVEAAAAYREAVTATPGSAEAWFALGLVMRDVGMYHPARVAFARVLELAPDDAQAAFEAAQLDLMAGRWDEGFSRWNARLRRGEALLPENLEGVPWDGSPAPDATLLLQAEQGVGDALQFLRYAGAAATRVGRVVVRAHAQLVPLLSRADLPWTAVPFGTPVAADFHAPLLDLAPLVGASRPAPRRADWLATAPHQRRGNTVGIVWAGNPAHPNDAQRSAGLAPFLALRRVEGVEFRHFQFGAGAETAIWPELIDATVGIADFAQSAAAVAACDLVIAVDTAIVHLAGALGVPAWVVVPSVPDWRWRGAGETTQWYPLARVFRQPTRGDWAGVMAEVAAALAVWRDQTAMESRPGAE